MSEQELGAMPTREQIAVKAFELYCERGREDGHDVEHWLEAEAFLTALPSQPNGDAAEGKEG